MHLFVLGVKEQTYGHVEAADKAWLFSCPMNNRGGVCALNWLTHGQFIDNLAAWMWSWPGPVPRQRRISVVNSSSYYKQEENPNRGGNFYHLPMRVNPRWDSIHSMRIFDETKANRQCLVENMYYAMNPLRGSVDRVGCIPKRSFVRMP